jgi:transcriptional regulator with XRE-family HTH domain
MVDRKKNLQSFFGIHPSYLTQVESGKYSLSIEKIIELSNITGISTDYILKGTTNNFSITNHETLKSYSSEQIETTFELIKNFIKILKSS